MYILYILLYYEIYSYHTILRGGYIIYPKDVYYYIHFCKGGNEMIRNFMARIQTQIFLTPKLMVYHTTLHSSKHFSLLRKIQPVRAREKNLGFPTIPGVLEKESCPAWGSPRRTSPTTLAAELWAPLAAAALTLNALQPQHPPAASSVPSWLADPQAFSMVPASSPKHSCYSLRRIYLVSVLAWWFLPWASCPDTPFPWLRLTRYQ